jgi:hypothetical protein
MRGEGVCGGLWNVIMMQMVKKNFIMSIDGNGNIRKKVCR